MCLILANKNPRLRHVSDTHKALGGQGTKPLSYFLMNLLKRGESFKLKRAKKIPFGKRVISTWV